jgi:hypothetical protein
VAVSGGSSGDQLAGLDPLQLGLLLPVVLVVLADGADDVERLVQFDPSREATGPPDEDIALGVHELHQRLRVLSAVELFGEGDLGALDGEPLFDLSDVLAGRRVGRLTQLVGLIPLIGVDDAGDEAVRLPRHKLLAAADAEIVEVGAASGVGVDLLGPRHGVVCQVEIAALDLDLVLLDEADVLLVLGREDEIPRPVGGGPRLALAFAAVVVVVIVVSRRARHPSQCANEDGTEGHEVIDGDGPDALAASLPPALVFSLASHRGEVHEVLCCGEHGFGVAVSEEIGEALLAHLTVALLGVMQQVDRITAAGVTAVVAVQVRRPVLDGAHLAGNLANQHLGVGLRLQDGDEGVPLQLRGLALHRAVVNGVVVLEAEDGVGLLLRDGLDRLEDDSRTAELVGPLVHLFHLFLQPGHVHGWDDVVPRSSSGTAVALGAFLSGHC